MPDAFITAWEQDPGSNDRPDGGNLINVPVPVKPQCFAVNIINPAEQPPPMVYDTGTPAFRYWTAMEALTRCGAFWEKLLPGTSWSGREAIPVDLDHGIMLNASYERTAGLSFYRSSVTGRTIFSGESPDVLCHEFGHAILDTVKPALWHVGAIEIESFHEAFGDCCALLTALQLQSVRVRVLEETEARLSHASGLSRLAEQLGWAIRQVRPAAAEPDCMRNAVNSFFYQDPNTLPSRGPAAILSSESHMFSRVFTGAFYDGLSAMFDARPSHTEQDLLEVATDIARLLVNAVRLSPIVTSFFSQVAVHMISMAAANFPGQPYATSLRMAFLRHGIVAPTTTIGTLPPIDKSAFLDNLAGIAPAPLPRIRLSVTEYGLGADTILIQVASEAKRFDAAGAAPAFGAVIPSPHDIAARCFLEQLLRDDRLKTGEARSPAHTHELRKEGDDLVLSRLRILCTC